MRASALWLLVMPIALACTGKANPNDPRTCPAGLPALGGVCEVEGLSCSYGPACGSSAKCSGGAWAKGDVGCGATDAGPCPTVVPRDGEPCSAGAISCSYPCGDGGTLSASCTAASWHVTAAGCALPR